LKVKELGQMKIDQLQKELDEIAQEAESLNKIDAISNDKKIEELRGEILQIRSKLPKLKEEILRQEKLTSGLVEMGKPTKEQLEKLRERKKIFLLLTLVVLFISNIGFCGQKVFVLCYHSFLSNKRFPTDFSPEELRNHLVILKNNGFSVISVSDFINSKVTGNKNILITIDDGNESVFRIYNEILKPLDIKPLLAIYPAIISRKKYAMTWEQLKELSADGWEIASHGYFHEKLNQKFYDKSKARFLFEIEKSKKVLENKFQKPITIFVYPFGLRSPITIETLKNNGFKYAFTIDGGGISLPVSSADKLYEIPRYMMTQSNWKNNLEKVIKKANQ